MVDIAWLRKTHDRVDENVRLAGACCPDGQFAVRSVHRISGLESNNTGPAKFLKMNAQLRRGVS